MNKFLKIKFNEIHDTKGQVSPMFVISLNQLLTSLEIFLEDKHNELKVLDFFDNLKYSFSLNN